MSDLISAAKQALEALDNAQHFIDEYAAAKYIHAHNAAITSLRQAIADAEKQEPVATIRGFDGNGAVLEWRIKSTDFPAGTDLYTHPQPKEEQEPKCNPHPKAPHGFARSASHGLDRYVCECEGWDAYEAGKMEGVRLTLDEWEKSEPAQPKAEKQEPVAWMYESVCGKDFADRCYPPRYAKNIRPLYTHPQPAQPKEPLTDEWIRSKCNQTWVFDTVKQWVREVEAAHGIIKSYPEKDKA